MSDDKQQLLDQLQSLVSDSIELQRKATFSAVADSLASSTSTLSQLPDKIAGIRKRGYAFAAYLEQKTEVLEKRWRLTQGAVERSIKAEADRLRPLLEQALERINNLDKLKHIALSLKNGLPDAEREIKAVKESLADAERRLNESFSTLASDIAKTDSQLWRINWFLDQLDEASFKLLAGEALFLAAKAEWVATGKGGQDPDGILYLTDQRLIFEQKETTGKTLGLFGGKKVQEVEWELPLHQVSGVTAENKGFFGGKDMLNFTFTGGAKFDHATIEVKGEAECKFWAAQIERMIAGGANDERAIQPDAETLEAIRNAPTACHVCGATLPQLVASQRQIDCEYCGAVIRVG
jgi:hypothetical protein